MYVYVSWSVVFDDDRVRVNDGPAEAVGRRVSVGHLREVVKGLPGVSGKVGFYPVLDETVCRPLRWSIFVLESVHLVQRKA